jgi:(p)ppGpp synthase/HD superfamily hydrolase
LGLVSPVESSWIGGHFANPAQLICQRWAANTRDSHKTKKGIRMQNNWLQSEYIKAYRFAAQAHRGQEVPGTDLPYIMHLSFVSMEIIAALGIEKEREGNLAVQCALLHDVIEDTGISYKQVQTEFGEKVAQGVIALSKDKAIAKEFQMQDSLQRIQQQSQEVWMVKLADRISNLESPPHYWTKEKISRYREEAMEIYNALHSASEYLGTRLLEKIKVYEKYL